MIAHAFNTSTREAEAEESLWVQGWSGIYSTLQDSEGYIERSCLKQRNQLKKNNNNKNSIHIQKTVTLDPYFTQSTKVNSWGWGHSSRVENVPGKHEALASITQSCQKININLGHTIALIRKENNNWSRRKVGWCSPKHISNSGMKGGGGRGIYWISLRNFVHQEEGRWNGSWSTVLAEQVQGPEFRSPAST